MIKDGDKDWARLLSILLYGDDIEREFTAHRSVLSFEQQSASIHTSDSVRRLQYNKTNIIIRTSFLIMWIHTQHTEPASLSLSE